MQTNFFETPSSDDSSCLGTKVDIIMSLAVSCGVHQGWRAVGDCWSTAAQRQVWSFSLEHCSSYDLRTFILATSQVDILSLALSLARFTSGFTSAEELAIVESLGVSQHDVEGARVAEHGKVSRGLRAGRVAQKRPKGFRVDRVDRKRPARVSTTPVPTELRGSTQGPRVHRVAR